jgi:hypothetical protein
MMAFFSSSGKSLGLRPGGAICCVHSAKPPLNSEGVFLYE